MSKLIILQGPPACGKSTLARLLQQSDSDHIVIVNRDALRHMRGSYWVPAQEKLISNWENNCTITGLVNGYDVILDATNLNPNTIKYWKSLAETLKVEIEFKPIYTPLKECIMRDLNSDRQQHVGEKVIESFFDKYNIDKGTGKF